MKRGNRQFREEKASRHICSKGGANYAMMGKKKINKKKKKKETRTKNKTKKKRKKKKKRRKKK